MLGLFWPRSAEDRQSVLTGWVSQDDGTFLHFKHSYNTHAGRSLFNFLQCLDQHRTRPAPSTGSRCLFFFFSSKELLGELVSLMDIGRIQLLSCVKRNVAFHQGRHKLWFLHPSSHTNTHKTPSELHSPLHLEKKNNPVNRSLKLFFFIGMEKCLVQVKSGFD